jgi:predicted nucleic-acid-binding Zn-ribbon protein
VRIAGEKAQLSTVSAYRGGVPGYFQKPDDEVIDPSAVENAFDWIQLKRVDRRVSCPICEGTTWGYGGRVGVTRESEAFNPKKQRKLVQIVCKNCEYVMLFSERILKGPLED